MTLLATSTSDLRAAAPAPLEVPDARALIRRANLTSGTRVVVLDDDPTGSQSVHGVPVLTAWSRSDLDWAFAQPGAGFFILTNTRGLNDDEARETIRAVEAAVAEAAGSASVDYTLIARSDSTLRGHYPLETDVLVDRARDAGKPYGALLLAPAYIAAGRVTAGDVHYVQDGDTFVPVASTSYAQDATFGFVSSDIREYVEERTRGGIPASAVVSIGLDDIRVGGPTRVRDILLDCRDAVPVVVNALDDSDLDVVTLGLLLAQEQGARVLCRTGPSFVASRLGMAQREPLTSSEVFPQGDRPGHGLVVVGSHVELTTRQVARLRADVEGLAVVEASVPRLLDPDQAEAELLRCEHELVAALGTGEALLVSSRERIVADSGHDSLVIAQTVSRALVRLTRTAVASCPIRWVLAKGGITSSDTATEGLGIRRAVVAGQLFDGIVSVWLNRSDDQDALLGLPYIVFAGNVGDEASLAEAVTLLRRTPPEEN
ncbi:hypothetical protein AS850_15065 [Frondihabitans sp. 762G35]|uniref:four-carbon acid sugar kinase family protein n=1 Tax=Frondihabitans sp. 762G35 TaxID=1446794 RepID=UPI000D2256A8|nr:four-carbon acid sugar kinase family protein [Frondihabitans sp. 762G35]ARC58405.1 hypothetical protein AS850_15065 [Frondihabitans sp. 762G35]